MRSAHNYSRIPSYSPLTTIHSVKRKENSIINSLNNVVLKVVRENCGIMYKIGVEMYQIFLVLVG